MEFTDQGANKQDSRRVNPVSGSFTGAHHPLSVPFHQYLASPSLPSALGREILEKEMVREIEKERIRKEIREEMIVSEIERRCALEAKVRRELMMQMENVAPRTLHGLSYLSSSSQMMGFGVSPMRLSTHLGARPEGAAFEAKFAPLLNRELQIESRGIEVNPVSGGGHEKKKVIILGGEPTPSDENISGTKRKVEASPAPAAECIGVPSVKIANNNVRKTKRGWYHFRGRKHRSEEAALSGNKGTTTTTLKEAAVGNLGYRFWCDICKVGTHSKDVMSCHEKGRKHLRRLGRNEAKVSILVNDLAEWVDAYTTKCSTEEKHKVVDITESENHKLVGTVIAEHTNVSDTMKASVIQTEPENGKAVEYIVLEGESISEGSNVDEIEDGVEPENDATGL